MKWVTLVLISAFVFFQYKLWAGKGSYQDAARMEKQLALRQTANAALRLRNAALSAEVADLQEGSEAIAEIARVDLGYIEEGEIYYRLVKPAK